jgi:hypothetical protein
MGALPMKHWSLIGHSKYAPSSAHRWNGPCPASARLSSVLPERSSAEADEGTRVHDLTRKTLSGCAFPHDEKEEVRYAIALVESYVDQLGPWSVRELETKLELIPGLNGGTIDVLHIDPPMEVATIIDYKNGALDIQVAYNAQLLNYAGTVALKYPTVQWFRLVIVQPNSRTRGEVDHVKQWAVHRNDVIAYAAKIVDSVQRGENGEAPKPGAHCRYCPAFGICEATQSDLGFVMGAIAHAPSEIPDEHIARYLQIAKGLEDTAKTWRAEAISRMAAGKQLPHIEASTTAPHRQWKDDVEATRALWAAYGAKSVEPISPAQAEKLGDEGKRITQLLAFKPKGAPTIKLT